jgi:hypothetical protein
VLLGALSLDRVEVGVERHPRVDGQPAAAREADHQVGPDRAVRVGQVLLGGEVAVLGHPGGLDHVPQRQLSPLAAHPWPPEGLRQRAGLVVEGRELLRELPTQALSLALERAHLLLEALDQLVV